MKDWNIIGSWAITGRRYLVHEHEACAPCIAVRRIESAEDVGWYCPQCATIAPPEIQDVADLAHCHPDGGVEKDYLTNHQNWYLKGPGKK